MNYIKILRIATTLVGGFVMARFATPKLMGYSISVKSFTFFGEVLSINGIAYMYTVGTMMLISSALLFLSLFIKKDNKKNIISLVGFTMLLGLMSGALLTEFFIRPEPIPRLVLIASSMVVIALSQLPLLIKKVVKQQKELKLQKFK